jgi:hypothetical protein
VTFAPAVYHHPAAQALGTAHAGLLLLKLLQHPAAAAAAAWHRYAASCWAAS